MKCTHCNHEFEPSDLRRKIGLLSEFAGGPLNRCPRCGFEISYSPYLLRLLRQLSSRRSRPTR